MFPSQRPAEAPAAHPTPNRPPLPTRVVQPVAAQNSTTSMNGFAVPPPTPMAPTPAPVQPDGGSWGAALAAMPPVPVAAMPAPVEERNDAPIFVQMQQSWFRDHDMAATEEWGMPTAGYAPPPNSGGVAKAATAPAQTAPAAARPAAPAPAEVAPPAQAPKANGHNGSVPKPREAVEDRWRTAADDGWKRAMAAAEPVDAGTTRSGLPKRVPQAQLVPGGVQKNESRNQNRRSPDEVRGLLSAYHRGVQRGRTDGTAESAAFQAKEIDQ
jgi:hypothetical protein